KGLHINTRWGKQRFAQRRARLERRIGLPAEAGKLDDAAHQRKSVGMNTGRSKAEDDVTFGNIATWQQAVAFGGTNCETGEIIIAIAVHAWHFGGFTADERATGLAAPLGDARNNI